MATLADLILPEAQNGPAAGEVDLPEFIDEWITASCNTLREDRETVRDGLAWLNTESFGRHEKRFDEIAGSRQAAVLDDHRDASMARAEHIAGAVFFARSPQVCPGGYSTHNSTWKRPGHVGKVSLGGLNPGVPPEIVRKHGSEDVA